MGTIYDGLPILQVFAGIIIILFLAAEVGFWIGKVRSVKLVSTSNEDKQAGSIMGASLGLLAFLLAFTFGLAANIHSERKDLVLEEANALGTLYLRTDLLAADEASEMRKMIRDYVDIRVTAKTARTFDDLLLIKKQSEDILNEMWPLAVRAIRQHPPQPTDSLLLTSVNEVIDMHGKRVNAVFKRLPEIVTLTLAVISIITLGLMGYQSGLNGVRVLIPRTALIASLATVMLLVIDLDRPGSTLIEVSQKMMIDLQQQIKE